MAACCNPFAALEDHGHTSCRCCLGRAQGFLEPGQGVSRVPGHGYCVGRAVRHVEREYCGLGSSRVLARVGVCSCRLCLKCTRLHVQGLAGCT